MSEGEQVICPLSIVPVRRERDDRAEQVSQWLFGETADVLEHRPKWTLLRFHHDGYQGWVDNKQLQPARDGVDQKPVRSIEQFMHVSTAAGAMVMPFGAVLPAYSGGQSTSVRSGLPFRGAPRHRPMALP
jgi:hypothetical protein